MKFRLFEVTGIELEYMIVNRSSLKIQPIVDQLLSLKNGSLTADVDNGKISWSNELVAHVVELKTNGPTKSLENLAEAFHQNILEMNSILQNLDACLLPSAAHPTMEPDTEMQLWKHNYSEVYSLYNQIFDCKGHGWSNVQSMHINLPFFDDAEFEKLHAAIRVLLPIMPALSASSPIFDGQQTGFKDARLEVYKINQKEIPVLTGKVIPEQVFSEEDYYKIIFNPINEAIKPYDPNEILEHYFLNSRGAIARFDRNAIEIRVLDVQECPKADIAIAVLIIETLKFLTTEKWSPLAEQKKWHENDLKIILDAVIKNGEETIIENSEYLKLFGLNEAISAGKFWSNIYQRTKENIPQTHRKVLETILKEGSLSTRILRAVNEDFSSENLIRVYKKLAESLAGNKIFVP